MTMPIGLRCSRHFHVVRAAPTKSHVQMRSNTFIATARKLAVYATMRIKDVHVASLAPTDSTRVGEVGLSGIS